MSRQVKQGGWGQQNHCRGEHSEEGTARVMLSSNESEGDDRKVFHLQFPRECFGTQNNREDGFHGR